jgi:hypothetical protein
MRAIRALLPTAGLAAALFFDNVKMRIIRNAHRPIAVGIDDKNRYLAP